VLDRPHRLTTSAGFSAAVRSGRRAGTRTLVLHLATPPPAPQTPAQVGFVVSKAVGNAVVRNRVKRRLRHLVGERLDALPPSAVLVVRALPASATASFAGLGSDLDKAWRRLPVPAGDRP
jgi:ribonuclease P protein component